MKPPTRRVRQQARGPKRDRKPSGRTGKNRKTRGLGAVEIQEIESLRSELDRLAASAPPRWNADLILALADVDLVYVRLSALLCAADRVWPAVR